MFDLQIRPATPEDVLEAKKGIDTAVVASVFFKKMQGYSMQAFRSTNLSVNGVVVNVLVVRGLFSLVP